MKKNREKQEKRDGQAKRGRRDRSWKGRGWEGGIIRLIRRKIKKDWGEKNM